MERTKRNIEELGWFYKSIGRKRAIELLVDTLPGTYLLRKKDLSSRRYVLSVRTASNVQHFIITINGNGGIVFKNTSTPFGAIRDLIEHFEEYPFQSDGITTKLREPLYKTTPATYEESSADALLDPEYVSTETRNPIPDALDIDDSEDTNIIQKHRISGRHKLISLLVVLAVAVIVGVILFIVFTICGKWFCQNGGSCHDSQCVCEPGWKGKYCEIDVDECKLPHLMCAGMCLNTIGSYECRCPDGFKLYGDGTSCMDPYMIEMVRVPKVDELLDSTMVGYTFIIHDGFKMEDNNTEADDNQLRFKRDLLNLDDLLLPDMGNMDNMSLHTTDCDIMMSLDICYLMFQSDPPLCASVVTILDKLLDGMNIEFDGQLPELLDKIKVSKAYIDICQETIEFEAVYDDEIEIIPSFFTLQKMTLQIGVFWPTRIYDVRLTGNWMLGDLKFSLAFAKVNGGFEIAGALLIDALSLEDLVAACVGSFIPSHQVENVFQDSNFLSIEFSHIALAARFTEFGFGATISLSAVAESLGSAQFHLSVAKPSGYAVAVALAVSLERLSLATAIRKISGHDISDVPIIGDLSFPNAGILVSSATIQYPIIPFDVQILRQLYHINKGLNLVFETQISQNIAPITFYLGISRNQLDFRIIGSLKPVARDIIDVVFNTKDLTLPGGFDVDMILAETLEGLKYTAGQLTFPVGLPDRVTLIENVLVIDRPMAMFTFGQQMLNTNHGENPISGVTPKPMSASAFTFEAEGVWNVSSLNLIFNTKVSVMPPRSFVAEIHSPVMLSMYEILKGVGANNPPGDVSALLAKVGLGDLIIGDPYIRVYLNADFTVQASGLVMVGSWLDFRSEVMYKKDVGVAFGVVTDFEKGINEIGASSVLTIPGINMLRNTKFCIAVSSGNISDIGSRSSYNRFHSDGLSDLIIQKGISLAIIFQVPNECQDSFCRFTQNVLGKGAIVVVQGTLSLSPFQFILFVQLSQVRIEILPEVYLTNFGFQLALKTTGASIAFTCSLELTNPRLLFTGLIGIGVDGLFIKLRVDGFFQLIPLINIIEFGDIIFEAAIGPSPVGLSSLACGATVRLGLLDNPNAVPIVAKAYIGISTVATNNFFYFSINKLTIQSLLAAFAFRPKLPDFIANTGFPNGVLLSFSPAGVILPNKIVIPPGFIINGTINILGFEASCLIKLSDTSFLIDASIKPLRVANGLIEIGGRSKREGPRLMVDISWLPPRPPALLIEGYASVLGIRALVNVTMNIRHTSIYLEGSLWGLFHAHLNLTASYGSLRDANFAVEAYMKQDLFQVLRERALAGLESYQKAANQAIEAAQDKIRNAERHWDNAITKLNGAKQSVENAKQKILDASKKVGDARIKLNKAHSSLDYAKSRLSYAQNKIRNEQRKLDDAKYALRRKSKQSCPRKPSKPRWYQVWKWPKYLAIQVARGICKAAFWVAEKAVDAAKGVLYVAIGALQVAKGVVETARYAVYAAQGVLKAAEVLVAESRHLLDIGKIAIDVAIVIVDKSKIVLDAAILFLEGVKQVNQFGVKIIEAVVKVALGGIFDVKEIYFSANLGAISKSRIEAYISISWFGGEPQRYEFSLTLPSISDMVQGLLGLIRKQMLGGDRRKREIAYSFFESIGPNTDKLFNNRKEVVFDDCKHNLTVGILSLMEILHQLKNISSRLEVAPNLMFFNQAKQDTLLVLDSNGMGGLDAAKDDIDKAMYRTSDMKDKMMRHMQHMHDSDMTDEAMDDMMADMDQMNTDLTLEMEHLKNMEENSINSYKEELERNITRDNPSFPDNKTMSDMEMVENMVTDVSDKEINESVKIVEMAKLGFLDLENINENDTEALSKVNDTLLEMQTMLLNVAHETESMKHISINLPMDMPGMNNMMGEMGDMVIGAVQRKRQAMMGVNATHQLMQWFELDLNETDDDALDMAENSILMPMEDDTNDDDMMMEALHNSMDTPQDDPMSPVESLKMHMTEINSNMDEVMTSMGSMMNKMTRSRSKRDMQTTMDDMENMVNDVDSVHAKLQKSKDEIVAIQENIKGSHDVLDDLEHDEHVDSNFGDVLRETKSDLNSIMAEKAVADDNTEEVKRLQKIGITSWITMLDDNILLQKNISLIQFLDLLQNGVEESINEGDKEVLLETIEITIQVIESANSDESHVDIRSLILTASDTISQLHLSDRYGQICLSSGSNHVFPSFLIVLGCFYVQFSTYI